MSFIHFPIFVTALFLCFSGQAAGQTMSRADSLLAARQHFSFAVQYKKNLDYGSALIQYEKSIALNDTVYQVHYSFAELLLLMKKPERAKAEFLRTLALNPEHHDSAQWLARAYYQTAVYDSALIMSETMYRIAPETSLLAGIARLREYLGRKKEALEAVNILLARGEDSRDTLALAAKLSLELGEAEPAEGFVIRALKRDPNDRELLRLAVQASKAEEKREQRAGYLRRLAILDSTDTGILSELESIYRATGERKKLIWTLERHSRLSPRDTGIIGELAENLFAEKETARAEQLAGKGLEISPKDGRLHILLGEIYREKGESGKARTEYRAALADPKWSESAKQFLSRLDQPETDSEKKEREFFGRGEKAAP